MHDITLRQIEVIRAVMLRGTVIGAAEYLGVSAPGVSRLIKHTEETLNLRHDLLRSVRMLKVHRLRSYRMTLQISPRK